MAMTVKELIDKLKGYDGNLPVCIADWYDQSVYPSTTQAGILEHVIDGRYSIGDEYMDQATGVAGDFVCIGSL